MIPYANNTETRRNLAALRRHGWRILVTPRHWTPPGGFRYAIDNGAWIRRNDPHGHDFEEFGGVVEKRGAGADFVVLPDIVAGGMDSLALSVSWLPRLRHLRQLLLPIQDGMDAGEVGRVLNSWRNVGLFLGGSTEYKLREMYAWGMVARSRGVWYHVGRVNTVRRIRLCAEAGATSFDGTRASMFSSDVPLLDTARKQPSLLIPTAEMVCP